MPRKIIVSFIINLLLLGPVAAPAFAGARHLGWFVADLELLQQLELSETQKKAIRADYRKNRKTLKQKKSSYKKSRLRLNEAKVKGEQERVQLRRFEDMQKAKRDLEKARFKMRLSFEKKLSKGQRAKLIRYKKPSKK